MNRSFLRCLAAAVALFPAHAALAWDAFGHRLITRLALEQSQRRLGAEAPAWLFTPDSIAMISDQATTPDRWRSSKNPSLTHLNNPDHYLDVEDLEPYGLTLRTIPVLRHEFARQLALAREKPGFKGPPVADKLDPLHVREYTGFLPHAAAETWAKASNALRTVRILERLDDPDRAHQLEMAKVSARYNLGILAHYIGDAAQPLHTTTHHHGWVGDNPKGYTTDRGIHSYIDGGLIRLQRITADDVRPLVDRERAVNTDDPWGDVLAHIERSFAQVVPLYELKLSGDLEKDVGRRFIAERLADGASTLGALYTAAWQAAEPSKRDVDEFVRYDGPAEGR